jgi:predicted DCC family thiol-disulfide oxidoreductase YuxK
MNISTMNSSKQQKNKLDHIVFFDGICNLCNGIVRFLIRFDKKRILHFSSLQSDFATNFLDSDNKSINPETILFYQNGVIFQKSDAALQIIKYLPYFKILNYLKYIPKSIRNRIYDLIATNRYTLFGKRAKCRMTNNSGSSRFL